MRIVSFDERVRELEGLGATTSDAQSVVEVERRKHDVFECRIYDGPVAIEVEAFLSLDDAEDHGEWVCGRHPHTRFEVVRCPDLIAVEPEGDR